MSAYDALIGLAVLLVTILVPFGIAMFWLGGIKNRLSIIESDIKDLKAQLRNVDIRTEAHILSRRLLDEDRNQG